MLYSMFAGERSDTGCKITLDDVPIVVETPSSLCLDPSFDWGYDGDRPHWTSLSMLIAAAVPRVLALSLACDFTSDYVSRLPARGWLLRLAEVRAWTLLAAHIEDANRLEVSFLDAQVNGCMAEMANRRKMSFDRSTISVLGADQVEA